MKKSTKRSKTRVRINRRFRASALRLLKDPLFLYRACNKVGDLGVVGEKRIILILLLTGIARVFLDPPSFLVVGPASSGKSTVVKSTLQLFPAKTVIELSGLSKKALPHGKGSLAHKIFFLQEYRGGKDAQYWLRQLQSEGRIKYEYTA